MTKSKLDSPREMGKEAKQRVNGAELMKVRLILLALRQQMLPGKNGTFTWRSSWKAPGAKPFTLWHQMV